MDKFIPYEKLSKKKQRELNAARRVVWSLNPVTRRAESAKAYKRKTARSWNDDSNSVPFCCCLRWSLPALQRQAQRFTRCSKAAPPRGGADFVQQAAGRP